MAAPAAIPAAAYAPSAPLNVSAPKAVPFRERLLITVLFLTVLASCVAFIEPSPHDALMGVLGIAAIGAGVRFHRILLVPFALLIVWNVFGLMTLLNTPDQKAIQYTMTSVYLAGAAILFAVIVADNTATRMASLRTAYVIAAAIAATCGTIGYFRLVPGAEAFTLYGRALGMFKDPNVYGPFLILPALMLMQRMISRRIDIVSLMAAGLIVFGLFLSFSRGAWFHFAVSLAVVFALDFLTAPSPKARLRILGLSAVGIAVLAVLLVMLLSFTSLGAMFSQRAQLIQSYDVGTGGRFALQQFAIAAILEHPNGMGPFGFADLYRLQQHNVYLQAFLVYGWAGGLAYMLLVLSTLWVAIRNAFQRTPWQSYAIAAAGAYVGVVLEGFIIDTDHWRHYFLILGVIWGLAAANRAARTAPLPAAVTY